MKRLAFIFLSLCLISTNSYAGKFKLFKFKGKKHLNGTSQVTKQTPKKKANTHTKKEETEDSNSVLPAAGAVAAEGAVIGGSVYLLSKDKDQVKTSE